MRRTKLLPGILCLSLGSFCGFAQVVPALYGAVPTEAQLKWQETEMYCLVHFSMATFQNKEWGYGDAEPSLFNPLNFNAGQIVRAAKAGGFKGLVFVAKHHDGFALWPTKTSAYNISNSSWKEGKGDVVKNFQLATKKAGLKFGVYCSPWDRSNLQYGRPEYLETYRAQLKELYGSYGDLFISWHDGANGGDGYYGGKKEQRKVDASVYYDWHNTWKEITRSMQPGAVIFSDIGPDVRWVGNERGYAPETSWSTIDIIGIQGKPAMPGFMDEANLGSGTRGGKQWIPFEADVPLRPGWFYHPEEDGKLKSVEKLFDIYCSSVGRGGCLDLGLSPTTAGMLHQNDVDTLARFGAFLKKVFARDLTKQAKLTLSNIRVSDSGMFGAEKLTDGDRYSYWATDDTVHQAIAEFRFDKPVQFSLVRLKENIRLGQRINRVIVEVFRDGKWNTVAAVSSVGANRIIRLEHPVTSDLVRLNFHAPVCIALSEIGLFDLQGIL